MKNSEAIIKDSMRILTNRMDLVVEDGTPEYEVIIEELDLIDQKKKTQTYQSKQKIGAL